jgi:hypothetical protein
MYFSRRGLATDHSNESEFDASTQNTKRKKETMGFDTNLKLGQTPHPTKKPLRSAVWITSSA